MRREEEQEREANEMEQGRLKRILFGSPISERADDGTDPAISHLDCILQELIELLRVEHGNDSRAFLQSERELTDVINLNEGDDGEHIETTVACKRGILLFAIWRDPAIAERFKATDADLLNDLQNRVLPLAGPIFLANLGQRPDAFVALCSVMNQLWPMEPFRMSPPQAQM
jgi:hypothetical protein